MAGSGARGGTPLVHFVTKEKGLSTSVPIADVLSRLHIEVSGASATIRGKRTSLQTLTMKGSAEVFLGDGASLWEISFRSQHHRRPPRRTTARLMDALDWLGVLLVCKESSEKAALTSSTLASTSSAAASSSSDFAPPAKFPCKYGAGCRERGDSKHCARYSHPGGSSLTCSTAGCERAASGRFTTCCKQCQPSGATSHSSSCPEVQPVAILVVTNVTSEGEDWILHLRSLSQMSAKASSQLCRYNCGMRVGGRGKYDTCCKQCASVFGCGGHDAGCAGPGEEAISLMFQESPDLDPLLPDGFLASTLDNLPAARSSASEATETLLDGTQAAVAKECGICYGDDMEGAPILCKMGHSFCKACMARHVEEELEGKGVLPACPLSAECNHLLTRDQTEDILGTGAELMGRFDLLAQRSGLQALGAFPCARDTCEDWIVPAKAQGKQLVECPACSVRFCSQCKRRPYHFRIHRCEDVLAVDNAWHEWLRHGRDTYLTRRAAEDAEYQRVLDELTSKKAEQDKMIKEAEARKREFQEMEDWKARNCKSCPHCGRVINKVDGCDSMVCGRNYHGGDAQDGCGRNFMWSAAPAYTPQRADHIPKVTMEELGPGPASRQKLHWECEPGVYLRCAMCKNAIEGPLFLCIDCKACCACLRCANGLGSAAGGQHLPDSHVFSILWQKADLNAVDLEILKQNHLTTRRKHHRDEALSPEEALAGMGFPENAARRALAAAGGDLTVAIQRLLSL